MFVFGLRVCGELWVCGEFAALRVLDVGICVYAGFRMGDVVMLVVMLLVGYYTVWVWVCGWDRFG